MAYLDHQSPRVSCALGFAFLITPESDIACALSGPLAWGLPTLIVGLQTSSCDDLRTWMQNVWPHHIKLKSAF